MFLATKQLQAWLLNQSQVQKNFSCADEKNEICILSLHTWFPCYIVDFCFTISSLRCWWQVNRKWNKVIYICRNIMDIGNIPVKFGLCLQGYIVERFSVPVENLRISDQLYWILWLNSDVIGGHATIRKTQINIGCLLVWTSLHERLQGTSLV